MYFHRLLRVYAFFSIVSDDEILAIHPDIEEFLLPDINVAEDPTWENVVFENINLAEYKQRSSNVS